MPPGRRACLCLTQGQRGPHLSPGQTSTMLVTKAAVRVSLTRGAGAPAEQSSRSWTGRAGINTLAQYKSGLLSGASHHLSSPGSFRSSSFSEEMTPSIGRCCHLSMALGVYLFLSQLRTEEGSLIAAEAHKEGGHGESQGGALPAGQVASIQWSVDSHGVTWGCKPLPWAHPGHPVSRYHHYGGGEIPARH